MHITLNVLADFEPLFNVDTCDEGNIIVWSSTNTLSNNFCSKENNNIKSKNLSKKRKLQTFS